MARFALLFSRVSPKVSLLTRGARSGPFSLAKREAGEASASEKRNLWSREATPLLKRCSLLSFLALRERRGRFSLRERPFIMKEKSKITSLFPTKERREVLTGLSLLLLSLSCVTEGVASFHQRLRFARFARFARFSLCERPKVSLRATKYFASRASSLMIRFSQSERHLR